MRPFPRSAPGEARRALLWEIGGFVILDPSSWREDGLSGSGSAGHGARAAGESRRRVGIDLGSGERPEPGLIGVDHLALPGVRVLADTGRALPFRDGSVHFLRAFNHLEHLPDVVAVMEEIHRVLAPDGTVEITVPHFSNTQYYSDPTHIRPFGLYSFDYFVEIARQRAKRKVRPFYSKCRFTILEKRLNFNAPRALRFLRPLYRLAEGIFNVSPRVQEIYEALFCGIVSCRTIRVVLRPVKGSAATSPP
jgi:SAM-dependent methyltransferase